jgi:hypothetical protein
MYCINLFWLQTHIGLQTYTMDRLLKVSTCLAKHDVHVVQSWVVQNSVKSIFALNQLDLTEGFNAKIN